MTPIFDAVAERYSWSDEVSGLVAALFLEDWSHDRGLAL